MSFCELVDSRKSSNIEILLFFNAIKANAEIARNDFYATCIQKLHKFHVKKVCVKNCIIKHPDGSWEDVKYARYRGKVLNMPGIEGRC